MVLKFNPRNRGINGDGSLGVFTQENSPALGGQGGGLSGRIEYHASRFFQEVTNPSMVLGMALGVSAFNLSRAAILPSLLRSSSRFLKQVPFATRLAASSIALIPEVGTFWGTSKALHGLVHPGTNIWDLKTNIQEILGLGMTLGFLKSFGFVFGQGGALAKQRLGGVLPHHPMVWQQSGMLGGIMAAQGAEIYLGWRAPTDLSGFLTESLITLGHFNMGGTLSQRMFPGIYRLNGRIQAGMAAREWAQGRNLPSPFLGEGHGAGQISLKKYLPTLNPGMATPEGMVMMAGDQGGEGPKGGGGAGPKGKGLQEGDPMEGGSRKVFSQGVGGQGVPFKNFLSFLTPEKLGEDFCHQLSRLARGDGTKTGEAAIPQRVVEMREYINAKAPEEFREPLIFLLAQNLVAMGHFAEVDAILREESFAPPTDDPGEILNLFASFEDSTRLVLIQGLAGRGLWQGEVNPLDHLGKIKISGNRLMAWWSVLDGLVRDNLVPLAFQLVGGKGGEGAAIELNPKEHGVIQQIFQDTLESHGYMLIDPDILVQNPDYISGMEQLAEARGIPLKISGEPALVFPAKGMGLIREWNLLPRGFELLTVHTWVNEEGRVAMRPKMPAELARFGVQPQQWTAPSIILSEQEALKLRLIRLDPSGNAYLEASPPELMVYYPRQRKVPSFPSD